MYALKKINLPEIKDKKMRENSRNEFKLLTNIERHENVVHCFGFFEEKNGSIFNIVLEFVDGGDLDEFIQRYPLKTKGLLPERLIWFFFRQIADGVRFLHDNRILHRDLKPANILLTKQNVAKVSDLGLSRIERMTTGAKSVCGTPYYLAPERMTQKAYSYKADVWSLGCILYEMAALRCPFYGESTNEYSLTEKIREAQYLPIPHDCYSAQLNRVVEACLTQEPANRPTALVVFNVARHLEELFGTENGVRHRASNHRGRNLFG
ncbi:Serine/threonine-protein kinase Nek7 [Aphelenchoides avenae]|nr:Serine/threonine-protein kinase Nek7 [Aphelenchus avenae]